MEVTNNHIKSVALETATSTRASAVVAEKNKNVEASSPVVASEQSSAVQENTQSVSEQLQDAVSQINDYVQNLQRSLQFTVDEKSGKDVVKVLDKETKELIRQYPSDEVLQIARHIAEQKEDAINLFSSQV